MRELAFLSTTMTLVLAVVIASILITGNGSPAADPATKNTQYEWKVYDAEVLRESNTSFLRLTFSDGRIYDWRLASISMIQVFPPKWSESMGYGKNKTLLIQCGGVNTYVPVSGSDAAENLFDMLVEDAAPVEKQ